MSSAVVAVPATGVSFPILSCTLSILFSSPALSWIAYFVLFPPASGGSDTQFAVYAPFPEAAVMSK